LNLTALASSVKGALNSVNSIEFSNAIIKINDTFADELPRLVQRCDTQITSLRASLTTMQIQDAAFHAAV